MIQVKPKERSAAEKTNRARKEDRQGDVERRWSGKIKARKKETHREQERERERETEKEERGRNEKTC